MSLRLVYREVSVDILGTSKTIRMLPSSFAPYMHVSESARSAPDVTFFVEDCAPPPPDTSATSIIVHESKTPGYRIRGLLSELADRRVVWLVGRNAVVDVRPSLQQVSICGDRLTERTVTRVIKDVLQYRMPNDGYVLYHASAVCDGSGRCVMFTGPKRAGKTTFMLSAVFHFGWSVVASDRVILRDRRVWGWPMPINLGVGSIASYDQLQELLPRRYNGRARADLLKSRAKVRLHPSQAPFPVVPGADLLLVCFVEFVPSACGVVVDEVIGDDLTGMWLSNSLTPYDESVPNWHRLWETAPRGIALEVLQTLRTSGVKFIRCRYGPTEQPEELFGEVMRYV
jgi:hypothetical protein